MSDALTGDPPATTHGHHALSDRWLAPGALAGGTRAIPRDGARVIVLSYTYWQSRHGESPNVLGTTIVIRPARYIAIGVAPRGFGGVATGSPDAYIPIAVAAAPTISDQRGLMSARSTT